mmetsp:Transcript_50835/g.102184  ORF Transcript_50835/g.102184 Transcript_50835/m.102184 type:complete len:125 (+) Transcript_50835:51-425(+)
MPNHDSEGKQAGCINIYKNPISAGSSKYSSASKQTHSAFLFGELSHVSAIVLWHLVHQEVGRHGGVAAVHNELVVVQPTTFVLRDALDAVVWATGLDQRRHLLRVECAGGALQRAALRHPTKKH